MQSPLPVKDSSEAIPAGGGAAHPDSLRRLSLIWLAAAGVLLLSAFLVIQDLAGANRPHELGNAPWVAGITLLNLVPCARVFRGLGRYARANAGRPGSKPGFYALVLGLGIVAPLNALILLGAACTVPAVLGG
jgi:hypothetical protein